MEYAPGPDGYVAWVSDGKPSWELYKDAIRADPRSAIGARQFPAEPMVRALCAYTVHSVELGCFKELWYGVVERTVATLAV